MKILINKIVIIVIVIFISGCSLSTKNMSVPKLTSASCINDKINNLKVDTITINKNIDDKQSSINDVPAFMGKIDKGNIKESLKNTLKNNSFYNPSGKYKLNLYIEEYMPPASSFVAKASLLNRYIIKEVKSDKIVFDKLISTHANSDEFEFIFLGYERVNRTVENVFNKNYSKFINEICQ